MVPILLGNYLYSFRHLAIRIARLCINFKPLGVFFWFSKANGRQVVLHVVFTSLTLS